MTANIFNSGILPALPSLKSVTPIPGLGDMQEALRAYQHEAETRQALKALEEAGREIVQLHQRALQSFPLPTFSFEA